MEREKYSHSWRLELWRLRLAAIELNKFIGAISHRRFDREVEVIDTLTGRFGPIQESGGVEKAVLGSLMVSLNIGGIKRDVRIEYAGGSRTKIGKVIFFND